MHEKGTKNKIESSRVLLLRSDKILKNSLIWSFIIDVYVSKPVKKVEFLSKSTKMVVLWKFVFHLMNLTT